MSNAEEIRINTVFDRRVNTLFTNNACASTFLSSTQIASDRGRKKYPSRRRDSTKRLLTMGDSWWLRSLGVGPGLGIIYECRCLLRGQSRVGSVNFPLATGSSNDVSSTDRFVDTSTFGREIVSSKRSRVRFVDTGCDAGRPVGLWVAELLAVNPWRCTLEVDIISIFPE